ncbi:response regulator [Tundrisphaera lichenicola]|uniref:hybrid sensor histidine kinase/response regulator n=1 Tax=Tundrisphaera lichenicola TaxID=2029860 RepID=UPI003EB832A2
MSPTTILHLEDSSLDAELIRSRLAKIGLRLEVTRVDGREEFAAALGSRRFDLILADYALPGFDGLAALEIARSTASDTPFLFVSGMLGEEVAIETLKNGATDYVLKQRLDRLAPAVLRALDESRERADRRRAEAALRESERMHRLTLDSVRDYAILTMDIRGRITGANAGARAVLGYFEEELIGRPIGQIYIAEDVRNGVPDRELERAGARGGDDQERWHLRKDGSRFWGSGHITPLLDESGQLRGFTKVVRDMTERKRADEALREADRRKDEFLAMLAHEIRNPLSAIQNASQLARVPGISAEKIEWAREVISNQVRHLAHLVDDLLDVSRINRGKIRLRVDQVDLVEVARRAVETARPTIEDRGHELSTTLGPEPLIIEGDPTRLEQVLINLLSNAAKYTEPGGRIALTAAREGEMIRIDVQDNGIGIGSEMLPHVFELFAQFDRSLDRTQGGLGVGLTIAQRLVELHGGTIQADSPGLGMGSTFSVRLPAAVAVDRPEPARTAESRSVRPGSRVLVVDDNLASASALADLLQMSGYDVDLVHEGREAIAAARLRRPEVVLLDIGLPGMDGYQVAEQLRSEEPTKRATIIAITGYGEEQAIRRSREAGFDHHLVKPVDYQSLLDLMIKSDRSRSASIGNGHPGWGGLRPES